MLSQHPRIDVTEDPELGEGVARVRAAEALFEAMSGSGFDLDLDAVDRLNQPPADQYLSATS